jgi:hypothetical protein
VAWLTRSRFRGAVAGEARIAGWAIGAGPVTEGADGGRLCADIAGGRAHSPQTSGPRCSVVEWWTPGRGSRRIDRD